MVNYMRFCLYEMCEPDVLNLRFLNRFLLIDLYQVISVWGCITYPIILVHSTHNIMLIYVNCIFEHCKFKSVGNHNPITKCFTSQRGETRKMY